MVNINGLRRSLLSRSISSRSIWCGCVLPGLRALLVLTVGLVAGCGSDGTSASKTAAEEHAGAAGDQAGSASDQVGKDRPVVVVVRPTRVDVEAKLTLSGTIEPYEEAALYAKITGFLAQVNVDIGDRIKRGEVLAVIDVPEMAPQLHQAEAALVEARAMAKLKEVTYRRRADLLAREPGAMSEQNVDLAEAEMEVARAEVTVAEANVTALRALMAYTTVRAPFDGIVTRRHFDTGALVVADNTDSQPILEVVRIDKVRLVFNVPEVVSPFVVSGLPVTFTLDAFYGEVFAGEITRCANVLTASSRSMRVEIDLDSDGGRIRPGMYATVQFGYRDIPQALTIPATALRLRQGKPGVFSVEGGVVRRVPVVILEDNGAEVIVRGDLDTDTALVLAGPHLLSDGEAVRVREKEGQR